MRALARKTFRIYAGWTLIATLLGLAALGVGVCQGADGHVGVETRLRCCCDAPEPEPAPTGVRPVEPAPVVPISVEPIRAGAPQLGAGLPSCQDSPLVQWTSPPRHHASVRTALGMPAAVAIPPNTGAAATRPAPARNPNPTLPHLRTTTLLI